MRHMLLLLYMFFTKARMCIKNRWDIRLVLCDIYLESIPKSCIFPHPYAITIRHGTIIGENCKIRQCTTIGERNGEESETIIGNNVSMGANVLILGKITIGDNSLIGAGSIVLKDVPANTKVIGLWK